jgi:hypothetical protein
VRLCGCAALGYAPACVFDRNTLRHNECEAPDRTLRKWTQDSESALTDGIVASPAADRRVFVNNLGEPVVDE